MNKITAEALANLIIQRHKEIMQETDNNSVIALEKIIELCENFITK